MAWTPDPFDRRVPDPEIWEAPRRLSRQQLRDDEGLDLRRPTWTDDDPEDER